MNFSKPARIEIRSPFRFRKLSYSVLSQQGSTYMLMVYDEGGSQREVLLRKLTEIDAIAFQSRDCRSLPSGCQPIRAAIAQKFDVDLPAIRKPDTEALGDSTGFISSDDCNQYELACSNAGELSKSVQPKWLYYVRSGESFD